MVYKLKPLELGLDFEDCGYDLGDSIDIQVTMTPNGDVDVRGGRLDLVCEQHYSQRGTTFVPERLHKAAMPGGVMTGSKREVRTDRKEKVMHSTVSLQEPGRFRNGTPSTRTARLLVQPTPPSAFRGGHGAPGRRSELLDLQMETGGDDQRRTRPRPKGTANGEDQARAGGSWRPRRCQATHVHTEEKNGVRSWRVKPEVWLQWCTNSSPWS